MSTQLLSVRESLRTTDSESEAPRFRPESGTDSSFVRSSSRTKSALQGEIDASERSNAWLASAKAELSVAVLKLAEHYTETRALNVIQLALQCSELESARTTALDLLDRVESGERSFDRAAPRILAQALRRTEHAGRLRALLKAVPDRSVSVAVVLANLYIDDRLIEEALDVLRGLSSPRILALEGFCNLELGRPQAALKSLRAALTQNPRDADASALAARAYRECGAGDKSLHFLKRAVLTAPGRRDIWMTYAQQLDETGQVAELRREIDAIKRRPISFPVEFLVLEARVEFMENHESRALNLLRNAQRIAESRGQARIAEELAVQLSLLRSDRNPRRRLDTLERAMLVERPSYILVNLYANELPTTGDAGRLRQLLLRLDPTESEPDLASSWFGLARLELDFERALAIAEKWEAASNDPSAAAQALLIGGFLTDDWKAAAKLAERFLAKYRDAPALRNNAAYALALGGRPRRALEVLAEPSVVPFYEIATRGLASIAAGRIADGLRWYRRAAELADGTGSRESLALMTIHQRMAMKRLDVDPNTSIEIEASSLAPATLPLNWLELPEFVLLHSVAERNGWSWPV